LIVADASPLIHLSKIGRLGLLKRLYGTILIPNGVWDEVVTQAKGRPGASEVERGHAEGWIKTVRVVNPKALEPEGAFGADGEVIALAEKRQVPLLLNDRAVAAIARTHGVRVVWLTRALVEAVEKNVVSSEEASLILRELVRAGLRVRSEVLAEVFHLIENRGKKKPSRVRSGQKRGRETLPDAGEATFGADRGRGPRNRPAERRKGRHGRPSLQRSTRDHLDLRPSHSATAVTELRLARVEADDGSDQSVEFFQRLFLTPIGLNGQIPT
jgi:predicted nucleic acid-binding protein